jgi:hypothetical protein
VLCRVLCYWLHGHSDRLDALAGSVSVLTDRIHTLSAYLTCLMIIPHNLSLRSCTDDCYIRPELQGRLVCLGFALMMALDLASHWMHLTAEVIDY